MSWFELARRYVAERWEDDAAKTREGIVDALAAATLALLDGEAKKLDRRLVRPAMRWALIPTGLDDHPDKYSQTIAVLSRHTLPVAALATPEWHGASEYAVDLGELTENPLHTVEGRKVKEKKVARDVAIDPRVVANPRQVRELLTCVSYIGSYTRARGRRLVAFYATIYYAGCQPSEATALRRKDCHLPDNGWGPITFSQARPQSEKRFTDTGKLHDQRGLKQREADTTRSVPIPPILVAFLRQHLDTFDTGQGGLLFHTERGWPAGKSMYAKVWREARNLALRPEQAESPLAAVPYDLGDFTVAGLPPAQPTLRRVAAERRDNGTRG